MKNYLKIAAISIIVILLAGCASDFLETRLVENPEAEATIIISAIAGKGTPFKQKIADKLVEKLQGRFTVEVMNLKSVKDLENKKYDAIVVMDACEAWMHMNSRLKRALKKIPQEKVVLLVTADSKDFEWDYNGLDAITGATVDGSEGKIVERIMERIDGKFPVKNTD